MGMLRNWFDRLKENELAYWGFGAAVGLGASIYLSFFRDPPAADQQAVAEPAPLADIISASHVVGYKNVNGAHLNNSKLDVLNAQFVEAATQILHGLMESENPRPFFEKASKLDWYDLNTGEVTYLLTQDDRQDVAYKLLINGVPLTDEDDTDADVRGDTTILSAADIKIIVMPRSLEAQEDENGLTDWLESPPEIDLEFSNGKDELVVAQLPIPKSWKGADTPRPN